MKTYRPVLPRQEDETMTLADKMTEYARLKAVGVPALEAELDRLKAINAELLSALTAADLTYQALARNHDLLTAALIRAGLPTSWLDAEIAKAVRIRAAIAKARRET